MGVLLGLSIFFLNSFRKVDWNIFDNSHFSISGRIVFYSDARG